MENGKNDVPFSIKDHIELFKEGRYQEMFAKKRAMDGMPCEEEVERVLEWTKTKEYRQKNFSRTAAVINPAKACQPLGAVMCALGFEKTLPFVHGSQGCVAYFRTYFARHLKEPVAAVSSSMTEDAAVFGGLSNMIEGLGNAYALYKPQMIAVSTTCMAEVIGDDLNAFINNARDQGSIPKDFPVPFAHTPSFVGSHLTGYDNMLKGILQGFTQNRPKGSPNGKVNIIPGFETYPANIREIKRILKSFDIEATVLADTSESFDSPNTGEFELYPGGTPLEEAASAPDAMATLSLQRYATTKTLEFIEQKWEQKTLNLRPIGVKGTDKFLETLSSLTGKPIPIELEKERGRLLDAMTDSSAWVHGKRFAIYGDPDLVLGLTSFLMEVGAEPIHVLCTNGDKEFTKEAEELLASSPFGAEGKVYAGKDLWHLRSLLFTEPVDFFIGNSHGKYLVRDTGTPMVRIGFPIFDRHHLHRYPILGYQGALNVLTMVVNTVLDELDRKTNVLGKTDISFDLIR
jgi:nitrogenase molybdenum-iron protein beta chain